MSNFLSFEYKNGIIYNGDCLNILPTLKNETIDLILCDPPYGHNNNGDLISRREAALGKGDYIPDRDNRPIANDGVEANDVFDKFLIHAKRLLKPGCCCCCCCGGGGGPDPMFANWSLAMNKLLKFKQMIIWDKGPMGMGWHYRRSYETILVAQKDGAACKWYDETNKIENIIRPNYKGISKIIPSKKDHPTPKPVNLMKHFIELHSESGDTVLDPFMGGGTTAIACKELGRKFIGIEFMSEYFEMSKRKLQNTQESFL